MKIAVGSDHAGFDLKNQLADEARRLGHDVQDLGAHDAEPSDYPDFAHAVARAVADAQAERGIVVCGSGVGASIAANKVPGVRAGNCTDTYSAHQGVEHDDMNVLVLGSRVVGPALASEILRSFLGAAFTGEARHLRRLGKVADIEQRYTSTEQP